mgnify:CR=1 FL=1
MNEIDGKLKYGGKEIVDSFNSIANVQGRWTGTGLSSYPRPMIDAGILDDPKATGLFTNDFNSPVLNFPI